MNLFNADMVKEVSAFRDLVLKQIDNLEIEYAEIKAQTYDEVESPLINTYYEVEDLLRSILEMETGKEKRFEHQ